MDTIIFASIFVTFLAMSSRRRNLAIGLFCVSLVATAAFFAWHATSTLNLSF